MAIRLKNIETKRKAGIGITAAVFVAAFGIFQFISTNIAQAAARTWVGGGATAVFSDPANWSGGVIPQDGDSIIMDEAAIPGATENRLEVTNDITGLDLTGISFVNTNADFNAFRLIGNPISIEGVIETDDTYIGTGNDMYLAINEVALDLTLTGPLTIEGVAIGDNTIGNDLNLGAFPLELINKGDEAICGSTGIVSSLSGSGAVTVSASGEYNGVQISGQNDSYTGPITVESGASLSIGSYAVQNVSMLRSEGTLTLSNSNIGESNVVIEAPMQLSGTLRATGGSSSHLGGCAGESANTNYVLAGGVELIGNLEFIGYNGGDEPVDVHIAAPYHPHQSTLTTNTTYPGVITTDAPILDTAPDAPTGLSATPSGSQIALNWTAPANNGGAAITDYVVQYKLAADSTWTTFNDGTSTSTSATITGLPTGQTYDVRVSAVNVVGTGAAVTESGVVLVGIAGAPTGLGGTPTAGQVALSWTAPTNNGGSAITDYAIEYKLSTDSTWTNFAHTASSATSRTVTGLANGASYDFRVATVNAQGQSGYATITGIVVPAVVAGAPTGLNGTPSDGQVALSWTAPANNGGSSITDYTVQYKLSASGTWLTFAHTASTATNRTVTGLANGEDYDFRVAAVNSVGQGGYVTITDLALPAVSPDAPTGLNGTPSNGQVALTWTAPADDGGSAITDYVVQYKLAADSTWGTFNDETSASTGATVTGLANGSTYDFRVATVNTVGTSGYATEMGILVPAVVAGVPTGLSDTSGDSQVTLSWTAPANNGGSAITDYTVQYKLSTDSTWITFNDGASTSTGTNVTGLANGSTYDFRVAAVNGAGTSSYATITDIELAAVAPDAPTGLIATPGDGQTALSWTAPVDNGGSAITDYALQYKLSTDSTWSTFAHTASTATSRTVTGLANGSTYDFRVAAVNAEGTSPYVTETSVLVPAVTADAPTSLDPESAVGEVVLSWEAPTYNGGSSITDYTVQYKLSTDASWVTFNDGVSATTSATVTGLGDGLSYDFRVAAVNGVGTSSYVTVTGVATPAVAPSAPLNLSVTPAVGEVLLDWDAPTSTGGATITDYVVEYKLSADSTWTAFAHTASGTTTRTVTGLTNGATYDFRVSAVNTAGTGPQVSVVNITVEASVASAPQGLNVTPSSEQAVLNWSAPATNGGAAISDYVIEYKLSSAGTWSVYSHTPSTATTATITDLTDDELYDFRVAAVNAEGQSVFTAVNGIEVSAGTTVADAPANLEATVNGEQKVVLDWDAPANNGGLPITEYVIGYKLSTGATWSYVTVLPADGTSYTFTIEITQSGVYDFTVAAVNADGQGAAASLGNFEYTVIEDNEGGSTDPNSPSAPNTGIGQFVSGDMALVLVNLLVASGLAGWFTVLAVRRHKKNSQK